MRCSSTYSLIRSWNSAMALAFGLTRCGRGLRGLGGSGRRRRHDGHERRQRRRRDRQRGGTCSDGPAFRCMRSSGVSRDSCRTGARRRSRARAGRESLPAARPSRTTSTRTWSAWIAACTFFSFRSLRNLTISRAASVGMPCCSVMTRRDRVVGRALDVARREVLGRHAAANHAALEDFPERGHLEVVVGGQDDRVVGAVQLDRRARALEVVALRDFLSGLVDGVVDLLEIDAGRDVEGCGGRHQCRRRATTRERALADLPADAQRVLEDGADAEAARQPVRARSPPRPAEAMHPHCEQSGLPPNWQGEIGRLKSADTQVVV